MWLSFFDFSGGLLSLKANAGNSRFAGSPCVFHIWTSFLLYFDSKFQEVLSCTQRFDNKLFIDDMGPLLFCSLCCGSEGITSTYNHSLHSVRHKLQKDSFTEACWGRFCCRLTCLQHSWHHCLLWHCFLPITASHFATNQSISFCSCEKWTILLSQIFCGWVVSFWVWFCSSNHSVLKLFLV